jgi:prevent-host-death family protein
MEQQRQQFQPIRFTFETKGKALISSAKLHGTCQTLGAIQYSQVEMTIMPITKKKAHLVALASSIKTISVADAKANLSSVLNGVQQKKTPVTILRRGIPIAQIVPFAPADASLYGSMRGTVQEIGDIISPTGVEWVAGDE